MRIEMEGAAPDEAPTRVVQVPHALPAAGDTMYVRVDPNDPSRVALEAA